MKDSDLSKPFVFQIAIVIFVFGVLLTGWTSWSCYQNVKKQDDDGYARASKQAGQVVEVVNAEMQAEMKLVQDAADKLSAGEVPFDQVVPYMQETLAQNPNILGMITGYAPYAYQPTVKLYAPYLLEDSQGKLKQIDVGYDYTDPALETTQWYTRAMEAGTGVWVGPYYGQASEDTLFTYSVPFKAPGKDGSFAGVVAITQSVTGTFKRFTQNVDLGFGGHLFLVNADKEIVFHPERALISKDVSMVSERITGFDLEQVLASSTASQAERIKGKILFQLDKDKNKNGETSWFFVRALSNSKGWKMVVVISTMDKTYDPRENIRQLTHIYLAFLVFMIGFGMLALRVDKMTTPRLMTFSVMVGFLFLAGIIWIWTIVYRFPELNHQKVLVNDVGINQNLEAMHKLYDGIKAAHPQQIPTGILIENLTMTGQSVKISGYLWQKYPLEFPEENINFPQLTDQVGGLINEEVYRYIQDDQRIVGWFFSTEIQQRFDNRLYPLDQAIIKIQIEPSKMTSQYVLVPAVLDYDYMNPNIKPGLDRNLTVRGWTIRNSFFTYNESNYGSTFGLFRQIPKDAIPNLIFNVRMNRNILSPIIAYCIVIYIVVMQVYGLSILKIENAYQVMSISAALFLVVAITHNGMRDAIVITGVVYLEYYFILLYLTILATTINAFMNAAKVPVMLLTYRDNLLIKILFWPAFLGISLFLTLITFYPLP